MYNSQTFIYPLSLDKSLKIVNNKNVVTHIINQYNCTIKQVNNLLNIKQVGDASLITLNFATEQDCTLAHTLLRNALLQLKQNQSNDSDNGYKTYTFTSPNTSLINDSDIVLPFSISKFMSMYVNGVLIDNENNINFLYLTSPNRIRWKVNAIYPLEDTDTITVHYV